MKTVEFLMTWIPIVAPAFAILTFFVALPSLLRRKDMVHESLGLDRVFSTRLYGYARWTGARDGVAILLEKQYFGGRYASFDVKWVMSLSVSTRAPDVEFVAWRDCSFGLGRPWRAVFGPLQRCQDSSAWPSWTLFGHPRARVESLFPFLRGPDDPFFEWWSVRLRDGNLQALLEFRVMMPGVPSPEQLLRSVREMKALAERAATVSGAVNPAR
jgi:hypothetical protein